MLYPCDEILTPDDKLFIQIVKACKESSGMTSQVRKGFNTFQSITVWPAVIQVLQGPSSYRV